jgi:hypothetical protein
MTLAQLRRQKQLARAAYARALTPQQRVRRAAVMTAAGLKLSAAGRLALAQRKNSPTSGK